MPDLKESIDKLNFLLGKWEGFGAVQYPTIEGCEYREELIFETNNCEPLITYIQQTFYKKNNNYNLILSIDEMVPDTSSSLLFPAPLVLTPPRLPRLILVKKN